MRISLDQVIDVCTVAPVCSPLTIISSSCLLSSFLVDPTAENFWSCSLSRSWTHFSHDSRDKSKDSKAAFCFSNLLVQYISTITSVNWRKATVMLVRAKWSTKDLATMFIQWTQLPRFVLFWLFICCHNNTYRIQGSTQIHWRWASNNFRHCYVIRLKCDERKEG